MLPHILVVLIFAVPSSLLLLCGLPSLIQASFLLCQSLGLHRLFPLQLFFQGLDPGIGLYAFLPVRLLTFLQLFLFFLRKKTAPALVFRLKGRDCQSLLRLQGKRFLLCFRLFLLCLSGFLFSFRLADRLVQQAQPVTGKGRFLLLLLLPGVAGGLLFSEGLPLLFQLLPLSDLLPGLLLFPPAFLQLPLSYGFFSVQDGLRPLSLK